jgi:hypothetical protein
LYSKGAFFTNTLSFIEILSGDIHSLVSRMEPEAVPIYSFVSGILSTSTCTFTGSGD